MWKALKHQGDRVVFLEWLSGDALDEVLTNAILFVLPSDLEGLSLALLDAMAAGVCVLTSDIPENRELVDGAGFTFHRGDRHDLERMLSFFISDEKARERAAAGLERVRGQYLWPNIASQVEQVYRRVLGTPAVPQKRPPGKVGAISKKPGRAA